LDSSANSGSSADDGEDAPPKNVSRNAWIAVPLVLIVFALLFTLDRHLNRRFAQVSLTFSSLAVHVEKANTLRSDARRAYVRMLEIWLSSGKSDPPPVQVAVDEIRQKSAEFAALAPVDAIEAPLMTRLTDDLSIFSSGVLAASLSGQRADAAVELGRDMEQIDRDEDAVLAHTSLVRDQASREIVTLRLQRAWLERIFLVSIAVTIGGIVVWRLRTRVRARSQEFDRLEQARTAALQSQFFASMSHELRTPLVAIRGFASDVEEHPGVDEVVRERSRRIHEEAMGLLAMINNILDAAQIESGRTQLWFEEIALEGVLARCVSRCQGLLRDKPVELTLEVQPDLPPIRADFIKLQQVFTNLIGNAIKFTEKGSVRVRASSGGGTPDDKVVVEIEDSGIGIAAATIPLIWNPFQQADASIARRYGGTGLGLSIVRGIVELHGGSIHVRSTPGTGSTFSVTLPRDRRLTRAPPRPS
jgi:signal transduction histidine kinase